MSTKKTFIIALIVSAVIITTSCANYTYKDPEDIEIPEYGVLKFKERLLPDHFIPEIKLIDDQVWILDIQSYELCKYSIIQNNMSKYSFSALVLNRDSNTYFSYNLFYNNYIITLFYKQKNKDNIEENKIIQFNTNTKDFNTIEFPPTLKNAIEMHSIYQKDTTLYLYTNDYKYKKSKDNGNTWEDCTKEEYDSNDDYITYPNDVAGNPISYYKDGAVEYLITDNSVPYYTVTNLNISADSVNWYTSSLGTNDGMDVLSFDDRVFVACTQYYEGLGFIPFIQLGGGFYIFKWEKK